MLKREVRGEDPSGMKPSMPRGNWAAKEIYKKLWKEAERQISTAREIVFIGYSFPMADFSVTNMIRRAMGRAKLKMGEIQKIKIVDPNAKELAERFNQSFKKEIRLENLFLSLESFLFSKRSYS